MKTGNIIVVGYTLTARDDISRFIPSFEAAKSCKTYAAKEDNISLQQAKWREKARVMPWLSHLRRIVAIDTLQGYLLDSEKDCAEGTPVVNWFADYLRVQAANDMYDTAGNPNNGEAIRLVGFGIRTFVKHLGLGAAEANIYLPQSLWYGSDHRDTHEMILPKQECGGLDLSVPLGRMGVARPKQYQPGADPLWDCYISTDVVTKLSLFPEFTHKQTGLAKDEQVEADKTYNDFRKAVSSLKKKVVPKRSKKKASSSK